MAVEGFVGLCGLIVISGVVSLAIDCFVYVTSATKDMLRMLEDVHKDAEIKEGRPRIFKQLCEFVEFHSQLRQLSNRMRTPISSLYPFNDQFKTLNVDLRWTTPFYTSRFLRPCLLGASSL